MPQPRDQAPRDTAPSGSQVPESEPAPPESLESEESLSPTSPPRARHWIALSTVLLVVIAVVVPPLINISRYHRLIADSMSAAVGRPVHMAAVNLVMLPRPGFEITDFVVEEDPAFGAEPVLRSATVRASIRLISLWRGRLEIARIHLEEPSLNLVRNPSGQWNVSSIFIQATRIPNAPTAQKKAGGTLRFPYIEASNARINFKLADEKKPFSFLNADLSLWLAQPDEWQLRFDAQPVRTDLDLNLADTGTVRVRGSLHRAPSISLMPLNLTVDWSGASLGQLSRLLTGQDPGWRGTVDLRGTIQGTPENALVKTHLEGSGIHRVEFEPDNTLKFNAACELHYRYFLQSIDTLTCVTPIGAGQLLLTGLVQNIADNPHPALNLEIDKVPVAALFRGMQLMRGNFPQGIRATGDLNGHFAFDSADTAQFAGEASVEKMTLNADGLKQPMIFNHVVATASKDDPGLPTPQRSRKAALHSTDGFAKNPADQSAPRASILKISPLSLVAPGDPPLQLNCTFSPSGFALHLAGTATMSRVLALNETFHMLPMPAGTLAPQGVADLNLTVHGPWLVPLAPQPAIDISSTTATAHSPSLSLAQATPAGIEGTLHLRNTQLATTFLALPLEIVSASATFSGNNVNWLPISINYGPLHADGSLSSRIPCPLDDDCARQFDLHVDSLDIATLQSTLLGARREQLVEEFISRITERPRPWPRIEGTLHIDTLTLNDRAATPLTFHKATARIKAEGNRMTLQTLTAKTLGGDLQATGTVDAGGDLPQYTLQLDLGNADAAQAASIFQERWGPGTIKLHTALQLSGFTIAQLSNSTTGTFHAEWTGHGSPATAASSPGTTTSFSRFDSWTADGTISGKQLVLDHSFLSPYTARPQRNPARASKYADAVTPPIPITGSITFARQLDLREGTGPGAEVVQGTLQQPTAGTASTRPSPASPAPVNHSRTR